MKSLGTMTQEMGIGGIGVATAVPAAVAEAARPRIGADRFRALADRLKNPAVVAPVLATTPQNTHVTASPAVASAAVEATREVVAQSAPPPFVPAPPPVEPAPIIVSAPAPAPVPEIPTFQVPAYEVPAYEVPPPVVISTPVLQPVETAEVEPPPTAFAPNIYPEQPAAPALSPLQRVMSTEHKSVAVRALPEILPPPPPPLPPLIVEENGERVEIAPPPMELVQERLREDATVRLQQLDIENIWRQVLAKPTLEERADYLHEAAAIAAAEQVGGTDQAEVPAEFDLSRIAEAMPEEIDEGQLAPRPYPQSDEQLETAELARSLLDMMASGGSSGLPHERALAADTLLRLLPKLAMKTLTMLAQRLAIMDNPPHLLIAKLIRDERIEVAGPLLEDCMQITDQDLLMVVAEDHPGKRRMLARRRKLSRGISDKLIAGDDPSVLLTLVRNANAEISHEGFVGLINAAARYADLMAPLSTRADLSATHAFELFWAAPAQLRRYLLHRFLTDSETLTKILKITLSSQAGEDGKDITLPSAGEVMEYLDLACKGRIETAAERLGEALSVDAATVHRILLDREGEALVVMLKAAGYPRSSVSEVLPALKRGDIPLLNPEREVTELQSMFDTLSMNKARILITYWNWAVLKSGPYAPVH